MTERTRFAFITEGGAESGLGHVARCTALAEAAAAAGASVSFVVTPDPTVLALLRDKWTDVVPVPWAIDPGAALGALRSRGADVVVVDGYSAGPEFLRALRSVAGQVVAVDDGGDRPLPVDVVVNGGVSAERLPYRCKPDTLFLLGPRYALVDPRYAEPPCRSDSERVRRALICLGGGSHEGASLKALGAVDAAAPDDCAVDVAVGSFSHNWPALDAAARATRHRVSIHCDRFGLRDLMLAADVAVSGGGVTLYELAATATPAVVVQMADNQARNVKGFEQAGAALAAGAAGEAALGESLAKALRRLARDHALRATMGARGRELVDGQGALRVAAALASLPISRR
ncbi:MAG: hypothetical protein E6I30_09640 [Chloroflexi bacterium]|nr:MAG: hypothetical protein E6I30_09640 [Chloroflexota bacterium]